MSVLVLHLLSKINSRSNFFLSLTKFIISSLNSSLFTYSLVKNFPPFLFKIHISSLTKSQLHWFIYSSFIAFRRSVNEICSWFSNELCSWFSNELCLPRTSSVRRSANELCSWFTKLLRRSLSNSTQSNVFTLLNIVLAPIATLPAFLDIISG